MSLPGEQVLLRIYLRGGDRTPHVPTWSRIVQAARREKLAGATVLNAILGLGHHGVAEKSGLSLIDHSPVIVEIVESAAKIAAFMRGPLHTILQNGPAGLLTLERAAVMMYRQRGRRSDAPMAPARAIASAHISRPSFAAASLELQYIKNSPTHLVHSSLCATVQTLPP